MEERRPQRVKVDCPDAPAVRQIHQSVCTAGPALRWPLDIARRNDAGAPVPYRTENVMPPTRRSAAAGRGGTPKKPRTGDDADYSNVTPPKSVDTKTKPQLTWLQQQRQLQHKERQANRGHKHKLGAKARKRARAREAKAAAAGGGGGD